jgi:hypothetical protein
VVFLSPGGQTPDSTSIDRGRFLQDPFQFIIRHSSYHSMLYGRDANSVVNEATYIRRTNAKMSFLFLTHGLVTPSELTRLYVHSVS